KIPPIYLLLLSLFIGALTGLFGIGGGFVAIPVLVLFFHTPQNKAAGTSLLIISLNCATAFIAKYESWPEIDWHYPVIIAIVAILIAQISSKLAPRTPTVHLKKAFAYLLFTLAAVTILQSLL
ncbi:MAG: TSUP family transporter, partial [Actinobacteria bacterium]|nr:TSUP family transporter [Actinomycetota bacterium]